MSNAKKAKVAEVPAADEAGPENGGGTADASEEEQYEVDPVHLAEGLTEEDIAKLAEEEERAIEALEAVQRKLLEVSTRANILTGVPQTACGSLTERTTRLYEHPVSR